MSDVKIETIDLLSLNRSPQLRSLLMENLSDRIMRQIAFALFQRMRHKVQLQSCVSRVVNHDDAISTIPDIILGGVADLTPLRGRMLVVIDAELIGIVVDSMCGATKSNSFSRNELSAMETRIGKQIIDLTFYTISEILGNLMPLNLMPVLYDSTIAMLAIAEGLDSAVSVTGIFETTLGSGSIKIIAPYAGLEPLEAKVTSLAGMVGARDADERWISALASVADNTPVEIRFELARQLVTIGLFESLEIGDILPFPLMPRAIAVAGGIDLFNADFGQQNGFICCRPTTANIAPEDATATATISTPTASERTLAVAPVLPQPAATGRFCTNHVEQVRLSLTVALGTAKLGMGELKQLCIGQVIKLEQTAGEPYAVLINGEHLAWGQPIMLGYNRYGLQLTALNRALTVLRTLSQKELLQV